MEDQGALDNGAVTDVIVVDGQQFIIGEPEVDHTLRILNVVGKVGMRAESLVAKMVESPTDTSLLFAFLGELNKGDLVALATALLQFPDLREGERWLLAKKGRLQISWVVEAFFLNLKYSSDLAQALANFIKGAPMLGTIIALTQVPTSNGESPTPTPD